MYYVLYNNMCVAVTHDEKSGSFPLNAIGETESRNQ